MLNHLHPDIEWEESVPVAGMDRTYRGHDGYLEWTRDALDVWESPPRLDVLDLIPAGDNVIAHLKLIATGAGSGADVAMDLYNVFTFRQEKIQRRKLFYERAEALEAAGLQG